MCPRKPCYGVERVQVLLYVPHEEREALSQRLTRHGLLAPLPFPANSGIGFVAAGLEWVSRTASPYAAVPQDQKAAPSATESQSDASVRQVFVLLRIKTKRKAVESQRLSPTRSVYFQLHQERTRRSTLPCTGSTYCTQRWESMQR